MDFEKAFADFIDTEIYDEAQSSLFMIAREAFKAGWKARGAQPQNKIVEIKHPDK